MLTDNPACLLEIPGSWHSALAEELAKPYIASLAAFVETERRFSPPVYPPSDLVFSALRETPLESVKVVVVGQDPYHGPGQAHGLSFSVQHGVQVPPSLRNIYKELRQDVGFNDPEHGCLLSWARQGVLLLNATLTVRDGQPKSHYGRGWERLTDAIIAQVGKKSEPVVFLLWGNSAKEKVQRIPEIANNKRHLILTSPHPSPLSAHQGFLGCRHFSQTNQFLIQSGLTPIDWNL
ncbi:MAG: uracil-DNA glycosylase [Chlamydiales bacterium]|nr:uracil-DNA glycosylase [Chlamydiales bacterium]